MRPILSTSNTENFYQLLKISSHIFIFQTNNNDLKNNWKGLKKLISLTRTSNFVPSAAIKSNDSLKELRNYNRKLFL